DIVNLLGIILGLRNRQAATPYAQINRRIKLAIAELLNYIRADNADLRCTMRDKGRHIKSTDADDRDMRLIGAEHQAAIGLVEKLRRRFNTDLRQHRQSFVEDPSLGDCKDEGSGHSLSVIT